MSMTNLLLGSIAASFQAGGGGGGGGGAAQINGITGSVADAAGLDITYANAPLGTAHSDRVIYAIHCFFSNASTVSPADCSVTIGGNAATLLGSIYKPSDNTCGIGIWAYQDNGALGANATVIVTDPRLRSSRSIAVLNGSGGMPTVLDSASNANTSSGVVANDLDMTGAQCGLYITHFQNGANVAPPSPFTDGTGSFDENSNEWVIMGWDNDPAGGVISVGLPTGHASLRSAYLALSLG